MHYSSQCIHYFLKQRTFPPSSQSVFTCSPIFNDGDNRAQDFNQCCHQTPKLFQLPHEWPSWIASMSAKLLP